MKFNNTKWRNLFYLIAGFSLFVLILEIIPRTWDLTGNIAEWISSSNKIDMLNEQEQKLGEITIRNNRLKDEINSIVSDYEENKNISSILNELNGIASASKVKITNIKPEKIEKDKNLWLQPMEINIESNFDGIYNFVRMMENSSKVIVVKSIDIRSIKTLSGYLNSNVNIEVYLNL